MSHHRSRARKNGGKRLGMALGVTAALLPLGVAPQAKAVLPPLTPPDTPTTVLVLSPVTRARVNDSLNGALCHAGNTCLDVKYLSINILGGVRALETSISTAPDPTVVYAYSGGAAVVANYFVKHASDPLDPNLSFVLIGNPDRKYGGSGLGPVSPMPDIGYPVVDITREYDSVSDFPNNPFNLLADANAFAGFMFIHLNYSTVNVYDPANTVWTEGNTTYVFVPTPDLPLLEPLRRLGLNKLADQLNAPLKAMVDAAYDRSYLTPSPPPPTPVDPPTDPPTGTSSTQAAVVTPQSRTTRLKMAAPKTADDATPPPTKSRKKLAPLRLWSHRAGAKSASTTPTTPSTTGANKTEPGGSSSGSGTGTGSGSGSAEASKPDASTAGGDGQPG